MMWRLRCRRFDIKNVIVWLKLFFLLVAALIVTVVSVVAFLPYAIFMICKKLHGIIENKVEDLKLDIEG